MNKHRYVAIGLNDYPGTGADLSGCVNDALDWARVLEDRHGATRSAFLTDGDATKANVVGALTAALEQTGYRDTLWVTYSGHGSWVPDRDGDEPDGRDECWVLHNYADPGYAGLLLDDDMHTVFSHRRFGARVIILSDSCNSGSVTRFADLGGIHTRVANPTSTRYLPPAFFLDREQQQRARWVEDAPARGLSRTPNALISGCRDDQVSYDAWFDGRASGAFTRAALIALNEQPSNLADWHTRIRRLLPNDRFDQEPQLVASRTQAGWKV